MQLENEMRRRFNTLKYIFTLGFLKERKLSFEFAILTSSVIVLIVLFMGWYINVAMKALNEKAETNNQILNYSLSATVSNLLTADMQKGDFKEIGKKVEYMLSNRLIAYIIIQDKNNKRILYSSLAPGAVRIKDEKILLGKLNSNSIRNTIYIPSVRGKYIVFTGFYKNQMFKTFFDNLVSQLSVLIIIFVVFALILSYFLSRKIISPLNSLVQATGEFEQGDLSNRVERTRYFEINELVESYNSMADALQRLYSSLGRQVEDRTKQLEGAYEELQNTQAMMVHSEKMKSLGELVAGIMHEINNPINFIYGNLSHLTNYSNDLMKIIDTHNLYINELSVEHKKEVENLLQEVDYEFLKSDLPDLIKSCKEGTERTRNIILDLKNFSRMEEVALTSVDLPKEFETTLNILYNKYKNKIVVHKEYQEPLPKIEAYGGQLNQVFMNILDNAAFALDDKPQGDVWIRIKTVDNDVIIEIEDNGKGMDAVTAQKIFNPFFTTKPVGQGTGLGMSISYKVIKNHQGKIEVDTVVGKGTKFTITLPINRAKEAILVKNEPELEIIE